MYQLFYSSITSLKHKQNDYSKKGRQWLTLCSDHYFWCRSDGQWRTVYTNLFSSATCKEFISFILILRCRLSFQSPFTFRWTQTASNESRESWAANRWPSTWKHCFSFCSSHTLIIQCRAAPRAQRTYLDTRQMSLYLGFECSVDSSGLLQEGSERDSLNSC